MTIRKSGSALRTARLSSVTALAAILFFCVAACSTALKVTVFNKSGTQVQACSVDAARHECIELAPNATGTLSWTTGKLEIVRTSCTGSYDIPYVTPWKEYVDKNTGAIVLVLKEDRMLLVLRNGQSSERVSSQDQPTGFPLLPAETCVAL